MKVKVEDVVQEMDIDGPDFTVYLNRRTGEFLQVSEDDVEQLEANPEDTPEWLKDVLPKIREAVEGESEDWLGLPDSFVIHEWEIMRAFASSIDAPELSDELLRGLHGRGAFRHFKDAIHRYDVVQQWDDFRTRALERIAVEWLESQGVAYTKGTE